MHPPCVVGPKRHLIEWQLATIGFFGRISKTHSLISLDFEPLAFSAPVDAAM